MWDAATGQQLRSFHVFGTGGGSVAIVAFSPDGKLIVTAGTSGRMGLWNVETTEELRTLKGHTAKLNVTTAFSPDDQTLISASDDGTVRIWDVSDGQTAARA